MLGVHFLCNRSRHLGQLFNLGFDSSLVVAFNSGFKCNYSSFDCSFLFLGYFVASIDDHFASRVNQCVVPRSDYVINSGGVINVYGELQGWTMDRSKRKAQEIYDTILRVFAIAERDGVPSYQAADRLAEERLSSVAALKDMWLAGDR